MFAVELWEMDGLPKDAEPTDEQRAAAQVWYAAEQAACEDAVPDGRKTG